MDEMGAWPGPEHDVRAPEILGNVFALEDGAVGDVTRYARFAITDDTFANIGPHSVAADQGAAFNCFAVVERDRDMVAMILEGVHTATRFERDKITALTRLEERGVNIGAMGHAIRLPELFHERFAERDIGNQLAGQRVTHFLGGGAMGVGEDGILQPDFLENAKDIGSKLNSSADLAEFRSLFENPDRKPAMGKCVGCDEPADASARNEKWGGAAIRTSHGHNLTSLGSLGTTVQ